MTARSTWVRRSISACIRWIEPHSGPSASDRAAREARWDVEQADRADLPWDAEPDLEGLRAALALAQTDPKRAFTLLYQLAELGSPVAMNAMGQRYYLGNVVEANEPEGRAWFRRAYEAGSLRGLLSYGRALFRLRDYEQAAAVFREGAERGFAPAAYWQARAEMNPPSLKSFRATRPLLERAMEMGSPAAKGTLGVLMAVGLYGLRNIPRGFRLFEEYLAAMSQPEPVRRKLRPAKPSTDTHRSPRLRSALGRKRTSAQRREEDIGTA